jgi:hypothetical protein
MLDVTESVGKTDSIDLLGLLLKLMLELLILVFRLVIRVGVDGMLLLMIDSLFEFK